MLHMSNVDPAHHVYLRQSVIFYSVVSCPVAKIMIIISYYHLFVLDWWQHPTSNYAASYGRGIWSQVSQPVASQADSDTPASDYTNHVWWHCEQEDFRLCVCNDQPWASCRLPPSIQVSSHHWCGRIIIWMSRILPWYQFPSRQFPMREVLISLNLCTFLP